MFRRQFLQTAAAVSATALLTRESFADHHKSDAPFKISLAEWSLHRALRDPKKNLTNLDFPRIAKKEFGIDAVEYRQSVFQRQSEGRKVFVGTETAV